MTKLTRAAILAATCLSSAAPSLAGPITTLYNTGVDASGAVLGDGTVGDPHYTLVGTPGGTTDIRIITSASGYPIPPYLGDNSTSRWIGPNNDADLNGPVGQYTYRTTFDLTGSAPSTAVINGKWSTDNNGVGIYLNGVQKVGGTNFAQFQIGFSAFTINSGFIAGLNTLDFVVENGMLSANNLTWNPTALRVEMTGKVPDGGTTVMMLGMGLVGLGALRRRL